MVRPSAGTDGSSDIRPGAKYMGIKSRICESSVLGIIMHTRIDLNARHVMCSDMLVYILRGLLGYEHTAKVIGKRDVSAVSMCTNKSYFVLGYVKPNGSCDRR